MSEQAEQGKNFVWAVWAGQKFVWAAWAVPKLCLSRLSRAKTFFEQSEQAQNFVWAAWTETKYVYSLEIFFAFGLGALIGRNYDS